MGVMHQRLLRLVTNGNDLTARQLCVLGECKDKGPLTVRKLAELLNVTKPAITRAIDKLEVASYARRKNDPLDRRSVLIELTAVGRRFIEAADPA